MTAVETLQAPKAKRSTVPKSRSDTDEEMPRELYDQFCSVCRYNPDCLVCYDCRDLIEGQKQKGVPDEEILTMAQVVSICKEVRAERYAKKQKDSAGG